VTGGPGRVGPHRRRTAPAHVRVALSSGASASEPGRGFLQDRLGVFGFWTGTLSLSFLALRVVAEWLVMPAFSLGVLVTAPAFLFHATASATGLALWTAARRSGALPTARLRQIDAGAVILMCTAFALMGATLEGPVPLVSGPHGSMLTATLAVAFTAVWRAVAIPSTPGRTAVLTTIAVAPLVAADLVVIGAGAPGPARVIGPLFVAGWAAVTLVIATAASDVVFGLRREVRRVQRLGQYTLDEKIGEGAMGMVYRASHAMLRRPTAIKLLPPERAGEANLQRFEREVQLTASLTHPNTVAIYDYGRTPDGVFYYAMELLDGLNLQELVGRHGAQPEGRVIHVLRQVCRALAEAHGLGLVHRDIKPANIILGVRGGEPDVAKVVDFGLVTRLDTAGAALETIDTAPVVAGTPLYLSPEAITTPDRLDARSDLYSLGAVAYLLLTGAPLFASRTLVELCAAHLHATPVAPSVRTGRPVDDALEALVLQCLAKDPDERPSSALALDEALGACPPAGTWTPDDARAWWRTQAASGARRGAVASDPDAPTIMVDVSDR
jgi:eukaryotic-like serine/threonine-protein kinase